MNEQQKMICGIDDGTKCPCIGSIFIAGVVADKKTIEEWKSIGVKDSKLVAPKKRQRLAGIIKETAAAYNKKFGDFGSGSPADPATRRFVWKHRKNPPHIIRTSWETYKHLCQVDEIEKDFIIARLKTK